MFSKYMFLKISQILAVVSFKLIKCQSCHHIETNQLICRANQLGGFFMMATLAFNELRTTLIHSIQ